MATAPGEMTGGERAAALRTVRLALTMAREARWDTGLRASEPAEDRALYTVLIQTVLPQYIEMGRERRAGKRKEAAAYKRQKVQDTRAAYLTRVLLMMQQTGRVRASLPHPYWRLGSDWLECGPTPGAPEAERVRYALNLHKECYVRSGRAYAIAADDYIIPDALPAKHAPPTLRVLAAQALARAYLNATESSRDAVHDALWPGERLHRPKRARPAPAAEDADEEEAPEKIQKTE